MVNDGDRVIVGLPEPSPFLSALAGRAELCDVTVMIAVAGNGGVAAAQHAGIRVLTSFVSPFSRPSVERGEMEFLPLSFHGGISFVERFAADLTVVVVAEPRPDGTVRPGAAMGFDDAAVHAARRRGAPVLALVVESQPQIPGDSFTVDDLDAFIELPADAGGVPAGERLPSELAGVFALHLSEFIPDGATVQAGVGGVPDEAVGLLVDKRDLGIHTEVLGGGLAGLVKAGVATGARKTVYPGLAVCTIADPVASSVAHENPAFAILGARNCLDPRVIAQNRLLRCVNSAVEIDLAGQVNAEMMRGTQYSGVGGQLDFFRGCRLAEDALSILAIESTTSDGTISRIVPWIPPGHVVTSSRYDVDLVITEHGVAWLRDRTVKERARGLIEIAHPKFRAELTEAAGRLGLFR